MRVTIDLETTGTDVTTCRIVEIAMLRDGEKALHAYVNPECPIEPEATEVHGITNDRVAECKTIEELAPDIRAVLAEPGVTEVNGYNLTDFDLPVLSRLVPKLPYAPVVDPLWWVRWNCAHLRGKKLEDMARLHGISFDGKAHSAVADAKVAAALRDKLMSPDSQLAAEQTAEFRRRIEPERAKWTYWLYKDRGDQKTLRMGCGKHCGTALRDVDMGYLRFCDRQIDDLPPAVRAEFLSEIEARQAAR